MSSKNRFSETRPVQNRGIKKGIDYHIDDNGRYIFTAHYLKNRGYCCKNGCRHCPYGYKEKGV